MNKQQKYTKVDHLLSKKGSNISSRLTKEQEAVLSPKYLEIKEAKEYKPNSEVEKYVKLRKENIKIPEELKKIGVQATSENQKYETTISLPISNNLFLKGLHAPVSSSLRWLTEQIKYILKKTHLSFKKVHGHLIKIVKK